MSTGSFERPGVERPHESVAEGTGGGCESLSHAVASEKAFFTLKNDDNHRLHTSPLCLVDLRCQVQQFRDSNWKCH